MIDYVIKNSHSPMDNIRVDLGVDKPLWRYVQQAVQDIEVLNMLQYYPIDEKDDGPSPFIYVGNWDWDPHPQASEIQYRRRETGDKLSTKSIGDTRIGILRFTIFCGARDKNKKIVTEYIQNKIYIPIEDEHGRYLIDNVLYPEYQLVDKLLYPLGKDCYTLKSLLPIVVKYEEATEQSIDGYHYYANIGMVKIFTTMEPIIACFMHIPSPMSYLGVFPILQFCDHVSDDKDQYAYFQPIPDTNIYIKGYKKGLEEFDYVRSIMIMSYRLIKKYKPQNIDELRNPRWWTYQMSYHDNVIEHRGACHEMHVARMLDTISANVLPIPQIDKRNMVSLLRYVLQTDLSGVNIYSFENKRLRLNEAISTIVTAEVSDKLKKMFKFGKALAMKDMKQQVGFTPNLIMKNMYKLGTIHSPDFANDNDYPQMLRLTRKGPNSLGRLDNHKIGFGHRQLHYTAIGKLDLLESSKDVGQTGMISPWADLSTINDSDPNKYPNIKYDLYSFIQREFPNAAALTFNANNIEEYNRILDKLVMYAYINVDHYLDNPKGTVTNEN